MVRIYPAIMGLDADQKNKLEKLTGLVDGVHVDVMDNIFVPNITKGTELINDFAQKEKLQIWAHLMIFNPLYFFDAYALPEGSLVSFHLESCDDIFKMIKTIREKKCMVSLAINPKTPVEKTMEFLGVVDQVLIMSVEPGFSGQSFLPEVLSKIHSLVSHRRATKANFRIGIDGGINTTNIKQLKQEGVDDFAVASGIFDQNDPVAALKELYHLVY